MMSSAVPRSQWGLGAKSYWRRVPSSRTTWFSVSSLPIGTDGWGRFGRSSSSSSSADSAAVSVAARASIFSLSAVPCALASSRAVPGAARPISLESRFCSACSVCDSFLRSRRRASAAVTPARSTGVPSRSYACRTSSGFSRSSRISITAGQCMRPAPAGQSGPASGRLDDGDDLHPQRGVLGLAGLEQREADLLSNLRVLGHEGARLVPPLRDPLAFEGIEGAGLLEQAGVRGQVDDLPGGVDADAIEDVELGLPERGRDLVLDHLDPGPVAHDLLAVFDRPDLADVEPHRGVELERVAAGSRLGVAVDHADLLAELVTTPYT